MAFVENVNISETFDETKQLHEDLGDYIVDTTPQRTPLLYLIGRDTAMQPQFDWLMDYRGKPKVPGVNNVMAVPEGQDAVFKTTVTRKRLKNLTHIFALPFDVSGSMRAANTAGVSDEYAYQAMRAAKNIPREIEFALFNSTVNTQTLSGNDPAAVDPDALDTFSAAARRMGGLSASAGGWNQSPLLAAGGLISTTASLTADESSTVDALVGTPPLTDVNWINNLQNMWLKGALPDVSFVRPVQKRRMNTFNESALMSAIPANQRQISADAREVIFPIDRFLTDFGVVDVFLEEMILDSVVHNMESSQLALATYRPFVVEPLAKIGDSDKGHVLTEVSFKVFAPNCLGLITGLSTTLP